MGKAKMAKQITFQGIPIVFDDAIPRGMLVAIDSRGNRQIFSIPLDPPPGGPPGKQEQGEST
jgi:hypothetical protein